MPERLPPAVLADGRQKPRFFNIFQSRNIGSSCRFHWYIQQPGVSHSHLSDTDCDIAFILINNWTLECALMFYYIAAVLVTSAKQCNNTLLFT